MRHKHKHGYCNSYACHILIRILFSIKISKKSQIKNFKNIRPLRKMMLNADGQTKGGTNKKKLTVACHYFDENLKNSLKI